MSKVSGFSMINGMTIVGKVSKSDNDSITIKKPVLVAIVQDQNGNYGGSFDNVTPFGESDEIEIRNSAVAFRFTPTSNITDAYNQQTTGLVMPTKPQLLTENN